MPAKTLYIKDSDVELIEKAEKELGQSLSSLFADCVRKRLAEVDIQEDGMRKIVLTFWDANENPRLRKSFVGRWLVGNEGNGERADDDSRDWDAGTEWSVAVTQKANFIVYSQHVNDRWKPTMETYDSVNDLLEDDDVPANVRAAVASQFDREFEIEMDI